MFQELRGLQTDGQLPQGRGWLPPSKGFLSSCGLGTLYMSDFSFGGGNGYLLPFAFVDIQKLYVQNGGKKNPTHFFLFFMLGGFWTGVRQTKVSPLEEHRRPLQLSVTMT